MAGKSHTLEYHRSFSNAMSMLNHCLPFYIVCSITPEPMISLLRSKSDEDILHSASPLLAENRASNKRGSVHGTSSSTSMIQELTNRLSRIHQDSDEESSPQDQHLESNDTLSPVIKVTSCSPTAQRKQSRSSSEDGTVIGATGTPVVTNVPRKSITPTVKKRYIPKHRKARSLGSK